MKLIPIPDIDGNPQIWINVDHLVSVMPVYRGGVTGIVVDAELKVDGMPLYRVKLGEHTDRGAAQLEFEGWLRHLELDPTADAGAER
ncbi:hypothetical protein JVX92_14915 (plasmid) [Microbacterium hominis]|uniref:hypothetical protein n=1 Tax=Microbacterium hominis TaxID=162426 RepID=UPI001964E982|nr:hypothetical protein [Microbacterium hominis]QRY42326.1 hypothetical protein JVX92_14915 [Microbacterium hominis]